MRSIPIRIRAIAVIGFSILAVLLLALAVLWFSLPSVSSLYQRTQSPSTRIVDRNGFVLYEIIDPHTGHHTPLALEGIPRYLRQATIAVEDSNFYNNPGVDVAGIVRALWINLQGGEVIAGGSTITQQLARMLLLDAEERNQRTLLRKIRESLLAWQIAHRYTKDEVLALYLNEVYYGNLAYGIEAAALAYFGKSVAELDLAECALLAGLPQSPVAYDPYNEPEAAKRRQGIVLNLMVKQGLISEEAAANAKQSRLMYAPASFPIRAPHFVTYVRRWLEDRYGVDMVIHGGLIVTTTLDLTLNDAGEAILRERLKQLQTPTATSPSHNTNNAALVAIVPRTGEILAMVGSPDFFDAEISGAVNAAVTLRQPGSAIKPITYATAFTVVPHFTAATPIFDVRTSFPTREGLPYVPENYDQQHHGPISVREALATSNNVAAVSVLEQVGLDHMLDLANALGIHSFRSADAYGLALTLGGGEVRLIELTGAYAAFANNGNRVEPYAVSRVADSSNDILFSHNKTETEIPVLDSRVAWLITDILSDNAARASAFGSNSVLRLSRPAAVKTGTTTDWRDNWTIGYTPDLVTGIWVGNANNEPMVRISGVSGAGPIWHDFMEVAHRGRPVTWFTRPAGLSQQTICALSGMLPSSDCAYTRDEWFLDGTQPVQTDNWYRRQMVDAATGQSATSTTPADRIVQRIVFQLPPIIREWARDQGWPLWEPSSSYQSELSDSQTSNKESQKCSTVNQYPCSAISLTQPDPGSIVRISKQLPISVQRMAIVVRVDDLQVQKVEVVIDDSVVIASFTAAPYNAFWTLESGLHRFTARGYYRDGTVIDSTPIEVQVLE